MPNFQYIVKENRNNDSHKLESQIRICIANLNLWHNISNLMYLFFVGFTNTYTHTKQNMKNKISKYLYKKQGEENLAKTFRIGFYICYI